MNNNILQGTTGNKNLIQFWIIKLKKNLNIADGTIKKYKNQYCLTESHNEIDIGNQILSSSINS